MAAVVERRFTAVTVEVRASDGQPRIGGYAAKFNLYSRNLGGFVEVIESSFFNKSRGDGWPDVIARYNHDDNMLLGTTGGRTLALSIDETGLLYEVTPPQARGDIVELVARGDVRKSSFAFRLPASGDEWTMTDQGFPLRKLVTGALVDVAPVNMPAYEDTTAGLRSLAEHVHADIDEVRKLAEVGELRKFFKRTDKGGKPIVPPRPRLLGAAAKLQLLARTQDPEA
jgi:HK97 family phage prohead protease